MYLTYRLAQIRDLSVAIPIAIACLTYFFKLRFETIGFVTELISTGVAAAIVPKDRERPLDDRMAAIAGLFFSTEEFADFIKDPKRKPFLKETNWFDWSPHE